MSLLQADFSSLWLRIACPSLSLTVHCSYLDPVGFLKCLVRVTVPKFRNNKKALITVCFSKPPTIWCTMFVHVGAILLNLLFFHIQSFRTSVKMQKAKLEEELNNITTVNLFLSTSNVLEKLLWVAIAVCGSLFIYNIVFAQVVYWQAHPESISISQRKLSELEPPAITLCHHGLQKFGFLERMLNHIDPEKYVPPGILKIRNLVLTLDFLALWMHPIIDDRDDFCKIYKRPDGRWAKTFSNSDTIHLNKDCQVFLSIYFVFLKCLLFY